MDRSLSIIEPLGLPTPPRPAERQLDGILAASGSTFMDLHRGRLAGLPEAALAPLMARAEAFLARCQDHASDLRDAASTATDAEIAAALLRFVGAWPNASRGDLAAYGAQLTQDVMDRQPSRHALDEGLRQLRQTSRFLPSIAEVLSALDAAQARVRNTVWHIEQVQVLLPQLRGGPREADLPRGRELAP